MGRQWAHVALLSFASLMLAFGAGSSARADEQLARGKELFALCSQCHGTNAGGMTLSLAPSIAGMGSWYVQAQLNKFRDGQRASNFDDITGMRMRGMARWLKTDDDVKAAAAYVSSLPQVKPAPTLKGGDATRGAALYATCSGCHGANAEGVEAVGGPALNHNSDWYLYTSLKNFKQGIRGSDPRDATGAAMRGMSMLLADDQAIKDVIAYIITLPAPTSGGTK
jgi:cytochrome c oxidase subunit 2